MKPTIQTQYKSNLLLETNNFLGESAVWDPKRGLLLYLDIVQKTFFSFNTVTKAFRSKKLKFRAGCFVLTDKDELIFASDEGIKLGSFSKNIETIKVPEFDKENCHMNDGKCDKQGNFLFGSMDKLENRPIGSLYRLNRQKKSKIKIFLIYPSMKITIPFNL